MVRLRIRVADLVVRVETDSEETAVVVIGPLLSVLMRERYGRVNLEIDREGDDGSENR